MTAGAMAYSLQMTALETSTKVQRFVEVHVQKVVARSCLRTEFNTYVETTPALLQYAQASSMIDV